MNEYLNEVIGLAMGSCGETEVSVNVILAAMEYIEDSLLREPNEEDELILDMLNDMLCEIC